MGNLYNKHKTLSEIFKGRWANKCGLSIQETKPLYLKDLKKSEWSSEFEQLRRNRLIIGAFRYGTLNNKNKKHWDRIDCIVNKAMQYIEDGNDEHLVDIGNYAMLEFEEGIHPKKHFKAVDDGEHAKEIVATYKIIKGEST